jgi:hypothetical protein
MPIGFRFHSAGLSAVAAGIERMSKGHWRRNGRGRMLGSCSAEAEAALPW